MFLFKDQFWGTMILKVTCYNIALCDKKIMNYVGLVHFYRVMH